MEKINKVIEDTPVLTENIDVTSLNNLTYASTITAIKTAGVEKECFIKPRKVTNTRKNDWIFNINKRISDLRADISKISQMNDPRPSPKMKRNTNSMKRKYNIINEETRTESLEKLKQRLAALNNRLSRYQRREKQYQQNQDFLNKRSKLFDELRGNRITINNPPSKENVENFWKPLYEKRKTFNKNATWLPEYKLSIENIVESNYTKITINKIKVATDKFSNWKSPGIDKLQNFWWNKLTALHPKTADVFDEMINQPEICPDWLTTGRTTLVAKKPQTENPSNYRPITCLPVIYKIFSSIIATRMSHHIHINNIIPNEQKGNASETYGTIDQLIINKMVMDSAKSKHRNISTAWIDYKKAFDSVPHDWIIETLKIHKFDPVTTKFFESSMVKWRTSLTLNFQGGILNTNKFSINTGIFQGDSPSGLIFILSLLPLSWLLKSSNLGYKINRRGDIISHLLLMDDIKIFAANDNQLQSMIDIVNRFSDDICMNFGIEKCKKLTIKRGKVVQSQPIQLPSGEELTSLDQNQQYKYLGFGENLTIDKSTKSSLKNEYFKRLKMILKSELSSKFTIDAINSYAIPALSYGFPILDWTITELEIIDRETRKVLQTHHTMHTQSDITRLYLPRKSGGRGLINVVNHFKNAIINFSSYLLSTDEHYLDLVSDWQFTRGAKSIHTMAQSYCQELNLNIEELFNLNKQLRKNKVKKSRTEKLIQHLKSKKSSWSIHQTSLKGCIDHVANLTIP